MMKRIFTLAIATVLSAMAVAQPKTAAKPSTAKPAVKTTAPKTTPAPQFRNSKDSAGYALGIRIAQSLQAQGLEAVNITMLQRAMSDVLQGKKLVLEEQAINPCIESYMDKVQGEKTAEAKKQSKAFHDAVAKRPGVVTLPSGLQYEVIKAGAADSAKPAATDKVKVHYHGTLVDGTVFDSSVERGEPIVLSVNGVISGWQEALQLMTVGSKWKLYLPSDLAYGDHSPPGSKIGPGSSLIFEVELISIEQQ